MDNKQNKYISVSYQLYTLGQNGEKNLEEQTEQGRPFTFISGFGFSLDSFEQHLANMSQGEQFDFTLTPAEAFGDYDKEGVHKMKRDLFCIDGKFDSAHIFPGAVITLTDSEEKRFLARVTEMDDESVTVDTNHPLAGETLQFTGTILENRDATKEEIQRLLNHMSHECGGCGSCGGDCEEDGCGGGCGHCHH